MDALLADLPPGLRPIGRALRAQVRRAAPGFEETVKWGAPFWIGRRPAFCLMVYPRAVHLGLSRGAELAERFPEIEGTGKSLRHLRIPDLAHARSPRVAEVLRAGVALDAAPSGPRAGPVARRTP